MSSTSPASNGSHGKQFNNQVSVVLGAQWGDEGKGKIVDLLATKADIVCRVQGGNNAGHTVVIGDQAYDFHLLPSGIVNRNCKNVIGNGVVVNIPELLLEADNNEKKGLSFWRENLIISNRAHMVFKFHQDIDGALEEMKGKGKLGTTKKGIGPSYSSKAGRVNLRIGDLMGDFGKFVDKLSMLKNIYAHQYPTVDFDVEKLSAEYKLLKEQIQPMVKDTVNYMHEQIHSTETKNILIEGANAAMLDIDFGTYPYVTSSNCTVGGVCTGLGIPPGSIGEVIGIVKAYTTRVGAGPFPTEQLNDIGDKLQTIGHEIGVTTKRKRRCGWLDLVVVQYAHVINHFSCIAVTKLDILDNFDELKIGVSYSHNGEKLALFPASLDVLSEVNVEYITLEGWKQDTTQCKTYEELPEKAKKYLDTIKDFLKVPVRYIGVGAKRSAVIQVY